jgi:hypothetical protein
MGKEKCVTEQGEFVRSADRRAGDVMDTVNDLGVGLGLGIEAG